MIDLRSSAAPYGAHSSPTAAGLLPVAVIVLFCALCAVLLSLPLSLPVGPMYWDTFIYYDGINRVLDGQLPAVDFEAPVGPLNYWLATLAHLAFPNAQPLLLIHFSFLVLTAPILALIAVEAARRSRLAAWGLVLPFLFFAALPFDTVDFYPFPGSDGFGYYNRHAAQLMYLVAAAVFFVPRRGMQAALIAVLMLALFLSKVTGFLSVGLVLAFGLFAGLIAPLTAIVVTAAFGLALAGIELSSGLVSAYVESILFLAGSNQDSILPRFLTALSQRFDVALAGGLLVVALLASTLASRWPARDEERAHVLSRPLARLLDHDGFAIGVCLAAGLVFETQNTGSQAFLLVWPPILRMLMRLSGERVAYRTAILVLVAAATLPTLTKTGHRAIRTAIAGITYDRLETEHLGTLGHVSAKDLFLKRADILRAAYPAEPGLARAVNDQGEPLSAIIASEPDFQLLWLKTVDEAVGAIEALETARGQRFETIFTLDFTNPFPFLLGRSGPKGVAIGADPFRTVPAMQAQAKSEISGPGLVLAPTCPDMTSRRLLMQTYGPALAGHEQVKLTPCYEAFIKR